MGKILLGELNFRFLNSDDFDILVNLINTVYEGMEDKSLYIMDTEDEIREQLENDKIVGIFNDNNTLVAFRHMALTDKSKELVEEVKLISIDDDVAYHGGSMVLKEYRGRGLQNKTREIMENSLADEEIYKFICTVSPDNPYSLRNVFKNGFAVVAYIQKQSELEGETLDRFILYKDTKQPFKFKENEIEVNLDNRRDLESIIEKGYIGIDIDKNILKLKEIEI